MTSNREGSSRWRAAKERRGEVSHQIAGGIMLFVCLWAYSPLGLGVASLVGAFDRCHQLQLGCGKHGVELVLHHAQTGGRHRHGAAAGALACLAQPASTTNPDHVIAFGGAERMARTARLVVPSLVDPEQAAVTSSVFQLATERELSAGLAALRPPYANAEQLCCLRSTILLI